MAVSGSGLTELSHLGVMGRTRTITAKTEADSRRRRMYGKFYRNAGFILAWLSKILLGSTLLSEDIKWQTY